MREHITTILPGAALGVMVVFVFASLGRSQVDPESTLYARANAFCHAMGEGDVDLALAFFRMDEFSEVEREIVRAAVADDLERLRGTRFVVTSVQTQGDEGDVQIHWRSGVRSQTNLFNSALHWVRRDGRWLVSPKAP